MHGLAVQLTGPVAGGTEEGTFAILTDAGGLDVFVQKGFEVVVRRHLVVLAAFLVEAHPPALAIGKIILDPRGDDGADAGEGIGHDAD
jgi:hypothetical protein